VLLEWIGIGSRAVLGWGGSGWFWGGSVVVLGCSGVVLCGSGVVLGFWVVSGVVLGWFLNGSEAFPAWFCVGCAVFL
jgi:hypothetical protein